MDTTVEIIPTIVDVYESIKVYLLSINIAY